MHSLSYQHVYQAQAGAVTNIALGLTIGNERTGSPHFGMLVSNRRKFRVALHSFGFKFQRLGPLIGCRPDFARGSNKPSAINPRLMYAP